MYFERNLQEAIEKHIPNHSEAEPKEVCGDQHILIFVDCVSDGSDCVLYSCIQGTSNINPSTWHLSKTM